LKQAKQQAKQQANISLKTADITKVDKQLFLKTITQRFTDAGLGKIEIIEFNAEKAEVKFRIWNNFFAGLGHEQAT